jgi:membrane protein
MWLSNVAILLGAEFDAELIRRRELEAGRDSGDPILPPRDTRKLKNA